MSEWVEPRIFLSAGAVRFQDERDVAGVFDGRVSAAEFADRGPFMAPALDVTPLPAAIAAVLLQHDLGRVRLS